MRLHRLTGRQEGKVEFRGNAIFGFISLFLSETQTAAARETRLFGVHLPLTDLDLTINLHLQLTQTNLLKPASLISN